MKTEIFATMGPACGTENIIKEMIGAGMTGMRLNLSHTTLPKSQAYIDAYHNAAKEIGVAPQILIDMQGPELRVGAIEGDMELEEGNYMILYSDDSDTVDIYARAGVREIDVPHVLLQKLRTGDQVLLDDGKILIEVTDTVSWLAIENIMCDYEPREMYYIAEVIRGGVLKGHKSIKVVGKDVPMPVLTEHDIENIKLAKQYGVTALMQPFVRSGEDLRQVRAVLAEHGAEDIQIFAKIENRQGVEQMDSIIPEADVIIIARGDLGNDMPLWELPRVQKQIEAACKKYQKPYVVVTQMLASMEQNPVPTRAEVSDIYHAVYHGAWGVMVTGETAVGKYPVEVIRYLVNTAKEAEAGKL